MLDSWLNTYGEIIEVGEGQHNDYAYDVLEAEMGLEELMQYMDENNCQSACDVLHMRDWVKVRFNTSYLPRIEITGRCIDLTKPMRNTINPAMNEAQINVAMKLCEKYNTSLHDAINDKRFR